jgi:AraC-like DNA-binding protein
MDIKRKRDGFVGQKLINVPPSVLQNIIKPDPVLSRLYVAEIGYFPNASGHYRRRREGCKDNILIYCVRGKGWYRVKDIHFELSANEFVILPATRDFLSYGADEKDPWTIYWLHFSGGDVEIFNRRFGIGANHDPRKIIFNEKGLQLWETMYRNLEMDYSNESLSNTNLCLYHLIATFLFPERPRSENKSGIDLVKDTILYMRGKLDKPLTVNEMAGACNLSTSHFTLLFRKATGMSPLDYFIRLKMEKACITLDNSNMKVKNIAAMIGYDDPYYFSRLFKKYMNMSPLRYRSQRENKTVVHNQWSA